MEGLDDVVRVSLTSLAIRYHILRALRSCLSIPNRYAMWESCL